MFKGPNGFGRLMNIFMCVIMCAVLSIVIPLLIQQPLAQISFLQSFVLSFCVAYPFGDLLPAVSWGAGLAGALHLRGFLMYLVQCVVVAIVLITCIAFVMSFINLILVGGMGAVLGFFLAIWPGALLVGFIAILVTLGPCMKVAAKASGFDPSAAPASAAA